MIRKAFTLIELLVVIAIIGLLASILIFSLRGTSESARAAACFANMRNLANAVNAYVGATERYPLAGSMERLSVSYRSNGSDDDYDTAVDSKSGSGIGFSERYSEVQGWISWHSLGSFNIKKNQSDSDSDTDYDYDNRTQTSHQANYSWFTSSYEQNEEKREFALRNGALWSYLSGNSSSYRCPMHTLEMKKKGLKPNWSYVMNGWFGWDSSKGKEYIIADDPRVESGKVGRADRRLLFAELQWSDFTKKQPELSTGTGIDNDCTLQYKTPTDGSENEIIGFNHKIGKTIYAHVVYLDGHVDRIIYNENQNLEDLTQWLCEAYDVYYNAKSQKYDYKDIDLENAQDQVE